MNANSTLNVKVGSSGKGVVAHVGLHILGSFSDRIGLSSALSKAVPYTGPGTPVHDRGKVLAQMALVLSGGGECCLDIEQLRCQQYLFGSVPSDTTVARTLQSITKEMRASVTEGLRCVREDVWKRSSQTTGTDPVIR